MNSLDQLSSMLLFARIVETQSFSAAAQLTGVSKSHVSKELTRLETALGVALLRRTTRRIEVTEIGRAYYEYCARIIAELNGADAFLRKYHDEPRGTLKVTAPVTFGNRAIVPVVARFLNAHVHVQVDLELTDRHIDLHDDATEVSIVIARHPPEGLVCHQLARIDWGLFASPEYLAHHGTPKTPGDLGRHRMLTFYGPAQTPGLTASRGRQTADIRIRSALRANNSVALLSAASLGAGIAYLPDYVAAPLAGSGTLVRLLPEWTFGHHTAYVTALEKRYPAPRLRLFVDYLLAAFATHPDFPAPDFSTA